MTTFNSLQSAETSAGSGAAKSIMLFGVKITEGSPLVKTHQLPGISQYRQWMYSRYVASCHLSSNLIRSCKEIRPRRKGVPWTLEEHKRFLKGLKELGKGSWKAISIDYVKTRTAMQVASHAQKYYVRMTDLKKSRPSLFDIPADRIRVSTEPADPHDFSNEVETRICSETENVADLMRPIPWLIFYTANMFQDARTHQTDPHYDQNHK